MSKDNLFKIIGSGESTTVEWKPSLSQAKEMVETIAAFSNTNGGRIFVGISNSGKLLGVQIGKNTIEGLVNQISQNTDPVIHPEVTENKIDDKEVIIIAVKEAHDKSVLAFGKPYIRVGKTTKQMSKTEYERRILKKHKEKIGFDDQIYNEVTIRDIDKDALKEFVRNAKAKRGLDLDERLSVKELLMRLKLVKHGRPLNGAILLFGKPQDYFPQCEIKCVRFKGTDVTGKMIDLKPVDGNIINQVLEAEKFIFDHISMSAWIESGKAARQEKWEYPPRAIREALANAIVHRDYQSTSKIQVRIFDDRIEFWNPGRLPEGWTVETLKQKHESIPPNALLAKQFFWIKYIEEVGTGTNKMVAWCVDWGLPEPGFEYTGTSLVVTFRKSLLTEEYIKTLDLNDRQKNVIEYLRKHKKMKSRDYAKLFGVTERTARNDLNELIDKRLIKRRGTSDKTAHYILAEI